MARRPPGPVKDILKAIVNESDRGCVLVSAAWMDDRLRISIESLLRALELHGGYRVPKDKMEGLLKSVLTGCLDSALDRADFCRCIGMIEGHTHTALKALFQLRNRHFGHFAGTSRLTDAEVKDGLENFLKAVNASDALLQFKFPSESKLNARRHSKQRRKFVTAIMVLSLELLRTSTPLEKLIREAGLGESQTPSK